MYTRYTPLTTAIYTPFIIIHPLYTLYTPDEGVPRPLPILLYTNYCYFFPSSFSLLPRCTETSSPSRTPLRTPPSLRASTSLFPLSRYSSTYNSTRASCYWCVYNRQIILCIPFIHLYCRICTHVHPLYMYIHHIHL